MLYAEVLGVDVMKKAVPHIALRKRKGRWRYVVLEAARGGISDYIVACRVAMSGGNIPVAHDSMRRDFKGWTAKGGFFSGT